MPDVNAADIARMLEISKPRVTEYLKAGMPAQQGSGNAYVINTRAAIDWLIERAVAKVRTPDEGESLVEADLRKARADADLAEIRAATAANAVLPLADVEALLERTLVLVAAQLDGMAGRIAAAIAAESDPATCRQMIFDECRRIRAAMAAELETRAALEEGVDGDQAAAGEDTGPVGGPVPDPAQGERGTGAVAQ